MNREEALEKLRAIRAMQRLNHDEESEHLQADNVLLELIDDPEVTQAYNDINKWYA